jgi:hypothetical protein
MRQSPWALLRNLRTIFGVRIAIGLALGMAALVVLPHPIRLRAPRPYPHTHLEPRKLSGSTADQARHCLALVGHRDASRTRPGDRAPGLAGDPVQRRADS